MPETINEEIDEDLITFLLRLLEGMTLIKHGRKGWPHQRLVWLDITRTELFLRWAKPSKQGIETTDGEEMNIGDIKLVLKGAETEVLKRSGKKGKEGLYFSLVARDRGLDLECASSQERDALFTQFKRIITSPQLLQEGLLYAVESGLYAPPHMVDQLEAEAAAEAEAQQAAAAAAAAARKGGKGGKGGKKGPARAEVEEEGEGEDQYEEEEEETRQMPASRGGSSASLRAGTGRDVGPAAGHDEDEEEEEEAEYDDGGAAGVGSRQGSSGQLSRGGSAGGSSSSSSLAMMRQQPTQRGGGSAGMAAAGRR